MLPKFIDMVNGQIEQTREWGGATYFFKNTFLSQQKKIVILKFEKLFNINFE